MSIVLDPSAGDITGLTAPLAVGAAVAAGDAVAKSQSVALTGSSYNLASGHLAGIDNANTYTNSTDRPLFVSVVLYTTSALPTIFKAYVAGVVIQRVDNIGAANVVVSLSFIVPVGATYAVGATQATVATVSWSEL